MKHMSKMTLVGMFLLTPFVFQAQSEPALPLPNDANLVVHLNLSRLGKKMEWSSFSQRDFFYSMIRDVPADFQSFFKQPAQTGVDFQQGLWVAVRANPDDKSDPKNYIMISGQLADENKFRQLITSASASKTTIIEQENGRFMVLPEVAIGWNQQRFLILGSDNDKAKGEKKETEKRMPKSVSIQKIKQLGEWLNPDPRKSLSSNSRFMAQTRRENDILIWSDGTIKLNNKRNKGINPFNMDRLTKGNQTVTTIDFENGKVIGQTLQWHNDSLAPVLAALYSRKPNYDLLQKIPPGQPLFVMNVSMDMKGWGRFLQQTGLGKILKEEMKEDNLRLEDLAQILQGDILIAANKKAPEESNNEEEVMEKRANPFSDLQFYLAATVKDEKKMKEMIEKIQGKLEKDRIRRDSLRRIAYDGLIDTSMIIEDSSMVEEEILTPPPPSELDNSKVQFSPPVIIQEEDTDSPATSGGSAGMKPVMSVENGLFVMSFSEEAVQAFRNNTSNPVLKKMAVEFGNKPMVMSLDIGELVNMIDGLTGKLSSSKAGRQAEAFLEAFDKWVIYGGDYHDGALHTYSEFRFSDTNSNSLEFLMNIFEQTGEDIKRLTEKNNAMEDEAIVEEYKEEGIAIPAQPMYDKNPDYVGGDKAWTKFLKKNLNTQVPKKNGAPAGTYEVEISFVVSPEGKASDFSFSTNHGYGMEEEAYRIFKAVDKWQPAIFQGEPVSSVLTKKIVFVVGK